jgi:uncharacterized protein with beta-barrel porin domain
LRENYAGGGVWGKVMMRMNGRLGAWRGALLGSVSLVAMECASGAEAACLGENTGNVLCDAAHPATGGQLQTSSSVDTVVNINAGSGIAGAWGVGVSGNGSITFNHNDPAGIRSSMFEAIRIYGNAGAITYTGSADVIGANGIRISANGGPVSVTQTAGTITGISIDSGAWLGTDGSVNVNTVGSKVAEGGIFVRKFGSAPSNITITADEIAAIDYSIWAATAGGSVNAGNLSVTANGNVVGRIYMSTAGTGTVDLTTKAGVAGDINVEATNQANTSAFTVMLNRNVAGNVRLYNAGTGTTTVRTRDIAGTFSAQGGGANSSVVVDGNVNAGTVAATFSYGGTLAAISLAGGGTNSATFNGAISGTFDASAATHATSNGFVTGLAAGLASSSSDGSATLNANGPITVTGISRPGDAANVTGVSLSANSGVVPFDVNLRGAVSATSIGDTAATVVGITASQFRLGTLRLTADGAVTATANAAGSTATGISVGATAIPTIENPTTYIVRANGDVTATSDGAATGISVTRGSTRTGIIAGAGGADLVSKGTVTANSTSAAAIGVRGLFIGDDTNAATLSLRTEGNVIANGTAAGSYGIFAQRGGTGDLTIDVLAGVQSTGTGIGVTRTTAGNMFITAGSNAVISGVTGIVTSGGTTTLVNNGSITGAGGTAIQFGGTNDVLRMMSGSTVNGNIVGSGTSILQLGGTGAASFDLAKLSGFSNIASLAGSNWNFTGNSAFVGTVNVDGAFTFNGDMSNASVVVGAGGTLGGNGTYGSLVVNGLLSPGNSPGTITTGSLTLTAASTYLVQVTGTVSDKTIVTGTANIAGQVVVDPLERLLKRTTYTIIDAGTLNGTFASASVAGTSNFARNAVLSYVGNDVLLTLDPGLLSPILSSNASVNNRSVAGGIDNALLGGANMSNAFSAIFNLSGNALQNGLTQISGETATGSQQTTFNAMNQFMGVLLDPFIDGRGAQTQATGIAYADEEALAYAAKRSNNDAYAAIYRKAPLAPAYDPRWSVWAAAYGGSQTTSGNTVIGSNDTTSRLFGTAVGFDYRFSPNTIAGFALAGGGTNFGVTNGGSGRSDLFQAGAFLRHNVGAAYLAGALAYGWQDVTTDRTVTVAGIDRLRAEFNANAWSGRVEGGYRFIAPWIGGVGLTPYAAGQFTTFELPAYAEQAISGANTFALAYNSKNVTNTRSELGLRADKSFALTNAILTLRGRAAWAHDFNPDRNIAATFQTLPGASFVVNGAAQASDSALTTASAEVKWMNGWSAAAAFEGEFSTVTRSYAGKGTVRYAW